MKKTLFFSLAVLLSITACNKGDKLFLDECTIRNNSSFDIKIHANISHSANEFKQIEDTVKLSEFQEFTFTKTSGSGPFISDSVSIIYDDTVKVYHSLELRNIENNIHWTSNWSKFEVDEQLTKYEYIITDADYLVALSKQ